MTDTASLEQQRVNIRLRRMQDARRVVPLAPLKPPVKCQRCGDSGLRPGSTTLLCRCQLGDAS